MFDETGQDPNAPFAAADWQRIDALIARARGAGLRVVLDLSAFRNHLVNRDIRAHDWQDDCLPDADRSPVDYAAIDPYRADLAGEWEAFLDFVDDRINTVNGVRYGADATIAVISIAGEPMPPASAGVRQGDVNRRSRPTSTSGRSDTSPPSTRTTSAPTAASSTPTGRSCTAVARPASMAPRSSALPTTRCRRVHTYPAHYEPDGITPIDYQAPELGPDRDRPRQAVVHGGVRVDAVGR